MKKRLALVMVALGAASALGQGAAQRDPARVTFEAAKKVESVDGDLKAAIELYRKVAESKDSSLASQAHLRMAGIYRRLGDVQAQARHELLARGDAAQGRGATTSPSRASSDAPVSSLVLTVESIAPARFMFITPDGRFLSTSSRSTGEIVIRDMSTGQSERLGPGRADAAMVSPDGRRVALVHQKEFGAYEVQVQERRPNSAPSVILDSSGGTPYMAAWSKDSSSIVLTRIKQDRTWEIGMLSVADRRFHQIVSLGWRHLGDRPSLSPDNRYIAYSALANAPGKPAGIGGDRPTPPDSGDQSIYVVAVDGSGEKEVVKGSGINESPVWTEDGSHILFLSDRAGTFGLYAVAIRNGAASGKPSPVKGAQITDRVTPIAITKDGAFYYGRDSAGQDVFQKNVRPDGKVQDPSTRISDNFVNQTSSPAYSPTGDRVAFVRRSSTSSGLVVQDLASGREKTYQMLYSHVWMPDGRRILGQVRGVSEGGWREGITLLNLETGELTPVLSATANAFSGPLGVSPDGNTVYVVAGLSDRRRIVAIDLNTRQPRDVWTAPEKTSLRGLALSPDGQTLAMTSDRSLAIRGSDISLARVSVDGTGYKELAAATSALAWRLDGRAILCQDDRLRLMWIPANGGDPEFTGLTLDGGSALNGVHLVSLRPPMGSQIAFTNRSPTELWKLEKLSSVLKD